LAAIGQFLAAAAVAVLTYHLVKATRKYVALTNELAQAARAEQEARVVQQTADFGRLHALVQDLRDQAGRLPSGQETSPQMIGLVLWTDMDLYDLFRLAANVALASAASKAIGHLRWLGRRVADMQALKAHERDWRLIPWNEWEEHLAGARRALDNLHSSVEAMFPTRASMAMVHERMGGQR
jgi:hypothetical protein